MTVEEIFAKLSAREVEGMMFHADMADYFDFLGLKGFKRLHEYQFLSESVEFRKVHRYYISHFNRLVMQNPVKSDSYIPAAWYDYARQDVDPAAKKTAVQSCIEKYVTWERKTKELYEQAYCDLCEIGEVAAAMIVKCLICDVDFELKHAYRMHIELKSVGYDMVYIYELQRHLHDKYKERIEKVVCDLD